MDLSHLPLLFLSLGACAVPLYLGGRLGRLPYVSPLHIVGGLALAGGLLKTLSFSLGGSNLYFETFTVEQSSILSGYLFYIAFILLVSLGYAVGVRRGVTHSIAASYRVPIPRDKALVVFAVAAMLVFLIVTSAFIKARGGLGISAAYDLSVVQGLNRSKMDRIDGVTGFGASHAAIKIFYVIPAFAFISLCQWAFASARWKYTLAAVVLGLACLWASLLQGKRLALLDIMVYVLIAFVATRGRLSNRAVVWGLASVALLVVAFGFMTLLRSTKTGQLQLGLVWEQALHAIIGSTYFLDVNMSVLVTALTPDDAILGGTSYTQWVTGWIPRSLYPGKGAVSLGPYVKQTILGMEGTIGGINPTGPGEAFLNFRWWGALVGVPLGFALRRIEEFLLSPRVLRVSGVALYAVVLYPLTMGIMQSSFSSALVAAFSKVLIIGLFVFACLAVGGPSLSRSLRGTPPLAGQGGSGLERRSQSPTWPPLRQAGR